MAEFSRILVTGHLGFTGRHLVSFLASLVPRPRIVGIDLRQSSDGAVDEQIVVDLLDSRNIQPVLEREQPHAILHLAGALPPADDAALHSTNVEAARTLLEVLRRMNPSPRALLVGSAAEYGRCGEKPVDESSECDPSTAYGRTKLEQSRLAAVYAARYGIPVFVARPFNLIGPGMSESLVAGTICSQLARARSGDSLRLGNLESARDFLDVRDAVAAYWAILQHGHAGEIYNVCRGEATTIRELAVRAARVTGKSVDWVSDDKRLQRADVDRSCGDPRKLHALTGWRSAIDLDQSLFDTIRGFERPR